MSDRQWLTVRQYAAHFQVSVDTVYKWRDHGLLTISHTYHIIRVLNEPPKDPQSVKVDVKSNLNRSEPT